MNPLARLMRARGHAVQGSDRSFDQGKNAEVAARLAALGIVVKPQDGSAVTTDLDRFVYTTAVEAETPEVCVARTLGLERVPGPVDGPVAAEACESDGTLTGYHAALGLIHNISRDHGEVDALRPQFEAFAKRSGRLLVNSASPEAALVGRAVGAHSYGAGPGADTPLAITSTGPPRARGILHLPTGPLVLDVPQPGLHNLENAAAAALIALDLGIAPATVAALLARFPGVARRFEVIGVTAEGVRVVDDYAHNGEKLRAAITAAQAGAARVLAVFQPHGFGPARFLRPELRELMPRLLRPSDRLCYAEIYYAGGSVAKDISSRMLADDLPAALRCEYAPSHRAVIDWIRVEARPGDTVLIMGARDPELPGLARAAFGALQAHPAV